MSFKLYGTLRFSKWRLVHVQEDYKIKNNIAEGYFSNFWGSFTQKSNLMFLNETFLKLGLEEYQSYKSEIFLKILFEDMTL